MKDTVYLASAAADAIAQQLSDDELALAAALLVAIGDQLALIAVCRGLKARKKRARMSGARIQ